MRHIKSLKEQMLEGELVKRKVLEDLESERMKELERRARQAKTREELDRANQDLKAYKEELKRKDQQEEQRHQDYA